jgi:type II secretory pathway pseudopilin PulG
VFAVPIATVAQGGTVADVESRCEVEQGRPRARRDRGFSVVEVVVTITLMAVVIVPIMNAVSTSIKTSAQGRSAAQVETALVNAADRVNRADMHCFYEIYVEAAVQSQGWAANRASVSYARYLPGATPSVAGSWSTDGKACLIQAPTEGLVQRVTITVTSPDGDIRREIQVVKSDV